MKAIPWHVPAQPPLQKQKFLQSVSCWHTAAKNREKPLLPGFSEAYKAQKARLDKGETNFPSATLDFMEQLLNQSRISGPVMLLGFAPPFYPAVDSGEEGKLLFEEMKKAAEKEGVSLKCHEYFCGISDLSYCGGMDKEELAAYAAQTPLWGSAYAMDIEAMAKIKDPIHALWAMGKRHPYPVGACK